MAHVLLFVLSVIKIVQSAYYFGIKISKNQLFREYDKQFKKITPYRFKGN